MAGNIINAISADSDCHTYWAIAGQLKAGPVTTVNPDSPPCDLLSWACGELLNLTDIAKTYSELQGKDIEATVPIAMLQAMFFRLQPLSKVEERATRIALDAASTEGAAN